MLSQSDFRNLLSTKENEKNKTNSSTDHNNTDNNSNKKRFTVEDVKLLSKKQKKSNKKDGLSRRNNYSLSSTLLSTNNDNKETVKNDHITKYRDRASERRKGMNFGGAEDEMEILIFDTKEKNDNNEKDEIINKNRTENKCIIHTIIGKSIYQEIKRQNIIKDRNMDTFYLNRTLYEFNLTSLEFDEIPLRIQISKEDCPDPYEEISGRIDDINEDSTTIIEKIKKIIKSAKKKKG